MTRKNKNVNKTSYWTIVKRIFSSMRQYKKYAILGPIFVLFECLFETFIPLITVGLVNAFTDFGDPSLSGGAYNNSELLMATIGKIALILVPLAIGALVCGILGGRFSAIAALGLSKNLRHDMYVSIQNYSFENIDKYETAGLVTRMTSDVFYTQMAVMSLIRIAVRAPLMLIFSFIAVIILEPGLSWIFFTIIPVIALFIVFLIYKVGPIFERVFKQYDDLNDRIEENVKGIRVVKSYVRSDYEEKLFRKRAKVVADNFVRADKLAALANPANTLAINVLTVLVVYFGGLGTLHGTISAGSINALISYGIQCLFNLMMLSSVFVNLIMSKEAMHRIYQILSEIPTIKNNDHPIFDVKDGSVEFDNVSFKYVASAEKNSLEDFNLKIKSGSTVGVIGATGSAKSTFISLIPRLYDVTQGEVKVGGVNVKDYDLTTLRDKVAVVLQKNVLFSGTIKSNLLWGNENATDEEIKNACHLACADEFIEDFDDKYDHKIEQGGSNVSGGQKQRLCIARALLKSPKILILDDSTSAVDTKTDAKIRKSFKEYIPQVTKFIIAQRIASVQDADMIIVLDDGKINGVGTHDELMNSNQIYRENFISQTQKGGLK